MSRPIAESLSLLSETLGNCKTNLKEKSVEDIDNIKISDVDEKIAEIKSGGVEGRLDIDNAKYITLDNDDPVEVFQVFEGKEISHTKTVTVDLTNLEDPEIAYCVLFLTNYIKVTHSDYHVGDSLTQKQSHSFNITFEGEFCYVDDISTLLICLLEVKNSSNAQHVEFEFKDIKRVKTYIG